MLWILFGRRIVAFSIGETRVGVVDRGVLAILSVVLRFLAGSSNAVTGQGWRWYVYARTDRFEAASARAIFDLAHISGIVHETVLTVNLAARVFRLDLVRTVCRLVAVTVAAILVVSIDRKKVVPPSLYISLSSPSFPPSNEIVN